MLISPPEVFQGPQLISEYFLVKVDLSFFIPYHTSNFLTHWRVRRKYPYVALEVVPRGLPVHPRNIAATRDFLVSKRSRFQTDRGSQKRGSTRLLYNNDPGSEQTNGRQV